MRGTFIIALLLLASFATAVPAPVTHNGIQYYKVDASIPSEDTGAEVCGKLGLVCNGYTEPSTAVCKLYHPGASDTTALSGDASGVYCDGAPQTGVCNSNTDTCVSCPACTTGIDCNTEIGNLYREMYVECISPPSPTSGCPVILYARNTQDMLNEIPALNTRLQSCATALPSPANRLLSNGNVQVDIQMKNGATESLTVTVSNSKVTGIQQAAPSQCAQKVTVAETDLDAILGSRSRSTAMISAYGQGKFKVSGCTVVRKIVTFFTSPLTRFIARRAAPPPPPPAPNNCRALGENCNQNPCTTGICAAPEEFINGRWQFVNYRCIDTNDYQTYCVGRGNTRAPWACVTGAQCQK